MEPNTFRKLTFLRTLARLHTLFCLFRDYVSASSFIHFHPSSGAETLLFILLLVRWVLRTFAACLKLGGRWPVSLGVILKVLAASLSGLASCARQCTVCTGSGRENPPHTQKHSLTPHQDALQCRAPVNIRNGLWEMLPTPPGSQAQPVDAEHAPTVMIIQQSGPTVHATWKVKSHILFPVRRTTGFHF